MTDPSRSARAAWVLFDGRCGLCDGLVRWLIRRDRRGALRFAPLEGELAARVRARWPGLPDADETLVLVERPATADERVRVRSRAVFGILDRLGGPWRLVRLLAWIPAPIVDPLYRFVAARRARWFGRLESCRRPEAGELDRFLELPPAEPSAGPRSATIPPP